MGVVPAHAGWLEGRLVRVRRRLVGGCDRAGRQRPGGQDDDPDEPDEWREPWPPPSAPGAWIRHGTSSGGDTGRWREEGETGSLPGGTSLGLIGGRRAGRSRRAATATIPWPPAHGPPAHALVTHACVPAGGAPDAGRGAQRSLVPARGAPGGGAATRQRLVPAGGAPGDDGGSRRSRDLTGGGTVGGSTA